MAAGAAPVDWLTDASWAFFWTVFVSIWAHMGFYTLILLAGLQAIPKDMYEAAEMDAASPWRTLRRINGLAQQIRPLIADVLRIQIKSPRFKVPGQFAHHVNRQRYLALLLPFADNAQ